MAVDLPYSSAEKLHLGFEHRNEKKMNKILVSTIILLFTFSLNIKASDFGGSPTPKEIIGFWKMVPLKKPEINKINPWPLPYQWFAFYPDGRLISMGKTDDKSYTIKELKEIFSSAKSSALRYRWEKNFLIVEYPDAPGKFEVWGMNLFRKDSNFSKKGDLVMTLAGGKKMEPVYYRHLTPIK